MKIMKISASLLAAAMVGMSLLSFTTSAEEISQINAPNDVVRAIKIYQAEYDVEIFTIDFFEENDWVQLYWKSASDRVSYEESVDAFLNENNIYYSPIVYVSTPDIPTPYDPPAPRYLLGDLDDDDTVSAKDAQLVLNAYAETLVENASGLTEIELKAADPNGDGELSAEDAQYILLYYAANTLAQNNRSWVDIIIRNLL